MHILFAYTVLLYGMLKFYISLYYRKREKTAVIIAPQAKFFDFLMENCTCNRAAGDFSFFDIFKHIMQENCICNSAAGGKICSVL